LAGTLHAMSLNVLHGCPRFEHLPQRLDLIAAEIGRQGADIVCLQEVPWTPRVGNGARYLARRAGMNYVYLRANGNRWAILFEEGEAILSRYPLQDAHFRELRPRAAPFEHRVVLQATAVTPRGKVTVFSTHLTHRDPAVNRSQLAALRSHVEQAGRAPSIVAGDLNATTEMMQGALSGWQDTYTVAHPSDPGNTCCIDGLTQRSDRSLTRRIDYLFLVPSDGDLLVTNSRRILYQPIRTCEGWLWASDHTGVLTTLLLRP
jgi:endonuclease/exonuclease/phosphatase family metal-dependent hydrolase